MSNEYTLAEKIASETIGTICDCTDHWWWDLRGFEKLELFDAIVDTVQSQLDGKPFRSTYRMDFIQELREEHEEE